MGYPIVRILQILPSIHYGGISSVVMNWYRNIDRSKIQFDFLTFNNGVYREEIESLGGRIFVLPTSRKSPFGYLKKVNSIIKSSDYEAVHIHNSFKNVPILILARIYGIKKRILHSHTSNLEDKWMGLILPVLKRLAIINSNIRLSCGLEAGEFLYNKKDFEIINNAIKLDDFINHGNIEKLKEDFKIPLDKKIVGHVGRFSTVKNHEFMINIIKDITQISNKFHFVFIGAGPLVISISEKIQKCKLENFITIVEPNNRVSEYMKCFDVFIFPSFFEGVSLALMEAQASGLNCIISKNIPVENDLNLGLISFLDIENNSINDWSLKILNIESKTISKDEIAKTFQLRKLDIKSSIISLSKKYLN